MILCDPCLPNPNTQRNKSKEWTVVLLSRAQWSGLDEPKFRTPPLHPYPAFLALCFDSSSACTSTSAIIFFSSRRSIDDPPDAWYDLLIHLSASCVRQHASVILFFLVAIDHAQLSVGYVGPPL